MPGTEVAIRDQQTAAGLALANGAPSALAGTIAVWKDAAELAASIANTLFVPKDLRNNPAAVTAAILTGAEVGLPPMASLSKIHVIEGRAGLSAEAMRALVLAHGHEVWVDDQDFTTVRVKLFGRRQGSDKVSGVLWTLDMAKSANLAGKDNWRKYPRSMLLARATGELCRLMFADVLGGISYTLEELDDGFDVEEETGGDPGDPGTAKTTTTRKAAPARKSAAARKQAPPAPSATAAEPPVPPLPGEEGYDDPSGQTSAPAAADSGADREAVERARAIGIKCQQAGLSDDDRHHLISAVTSGRVASGKLVTAKEGSEVLLALHEITAGRKQLLEVDGRWELVGIEPDGEAPDAPTLPAEEAEEVGPEHANTPAPPPVPPAPAVADVSQPDVWTGEQWREFLRIRGVKVTETIKQAQALARELDEEIPVTLDDVRGRRSLAGLLCGFVEDLAEQRGYRP